MTEQYAECRATRETPGDSCDLAPELGRNRRGNEVHGQHDGDESNGDERNVPLTRPPEWENPGAEKTQGRHGQHPLQPRCALNLANSQRE